MQAGSRKRPAPGSVPVTVQSGQATDLSSLARSSAANMSGYEDLSNIPDDDLLNWGSRIAAENASSNTTGNGDGMSNQLIRRNQGTQLAARPGYGVPAWPDFAAQQQQNGWPETGEDEEELESRAADAKRDAQAKRPPKQIPPFIQKLSSFLENPAYGHLIRWTDDGNSFVVLDEDEFAKQLIPELFKHNNYASFVRQLNMYGFHKKVGLSDNSMRASEKKAKSPSEYSNPYFRRGRPELLWLISKPKNELAKPKSKKPKGSEQDADADSVSGFPATTVQDSGPQRRNNAEMVSLPKSQLLQFQRELQDMKRQQQHINQLISHFQHENARFVQQASAQHERHENSINAILTFLATFYSRSVEGGGNFHNMFSNSIPDNHPAQGNVTDMGDSDAYEPPAKPNNQLVRAQRRPLALLPAPFTDTGRVSTASQSPRRSPRSQPLSSRSPVENNLSSPQAKEEPLTPDGPNSRTTKSRQSTAPPSSSDMMAAINTANANATDKPLDFSSALRHFENANGNAPLTPEQRDNMLSMMANNTGSSNTSNNMLSSLRNAVGNGSDYVDQFNSNNGQLDMLQRLQREQDARMQSIADRLQPLSPGGVIPGLSSSGNSPNAGGAFNDSGSELDFGRFINSDFEPSFFPENGVVNTDDFQDYGFASDAGEDNAQPSDRLQMFEQDNPATPETNAGRIVGSVASSSAPSPIVEMDDAADKPRKKQKTRQT